MTQHIEVTGAYGRTYTTIAAARADWAEGKDFKDTSAFGFGTYVNQNDAERMNLGVVVRFGKDLAKTGTLRKRVR